MEASAEPTAGEDDARVLIVLAVDGHGGGAANGGGDVSVIGATQGDDAASESMDESRTFEFGPDDYAYDLVSVRTHGEWRVVAVGPSA